MVLELVSLATLAQRHYADGTTSFCAVHGFRTVWEDEFDGVALNTSKWEKRTMGHVDRLAAVEDDDIYLAEGALVLRSQRRVVDGYNFTSGAVHTKGKHSWAGRTRVCVRARLPGGGGSGKGQGVQPAHWMMPETNACWPSNGGEYTLVPRLEAEAVSAFSFVRCRHPCNREICTNP